MRLINQTKRTQDIYQVLPMTIKLVVVKKVCRALDMVFRIAKAKAIAPLIP